MDTTNSKQETPSSAEVFPKVILPSSSGSFVPIRAPPTVDSPFKYSLSGNGKKRNSNISSYGSDYSGFESDGFMSSEDEFQTVLKVPYVADEEYDSGPSVTYTNDETLEDDSFHEEYVVSRPFVSYPDEEILTENSHVEEFVISRPFVKYLDEEAIDESIHVYESAISRPFVKYPDEEIMEESSHVEEFVVSVPFVEPGISNCGTLSTPKSGMPIAQLSVDSDQDSVGSEVEDDQFLGIVRIPSTGIVDNVSIAPKVRVLSIEEGDEDDLQFEDSILGGDINGVLASDEKMGIVEKDTIEDSISAVLVEDKEVDCSEVASAECLGSSKDYSSLDIVKLNEDEKHLVEEAQSFKDEEQENQENQKNKVEKGNAYAGGNPSRNMVLTTDIFQKRQEMRVEIPEVEKNFNFGAVLVDDDNCFSRNDDADVNKGVHLCQGSDNEKLQSEVQLPGDGVDTHDFINSDTLESLSLNSDLDPELKVNDKEEAVDVPEKLDEVEEGSFADDNAEGLLFGGSKRAKLSIGGYEQRSTPSLDPELKVNDKEKPDCVPEKLVETEEGSFADNTEGLLFGDSDKRTIGEYEQKFTPSLDPELRVNDKAEADGEQRCSPLSGENSQNLSRRIDAQIVSELGEEVNTVEVGEGKEIFDSFALAGFIESAAGSAGLNSTFHSLRLTPQPNRPHFFNPSELSCRSESEAIVNEEVDNKLGKIIVKFLRLVQILGLTTEDSIVAQVLYRLYLASGRSSSQSCSLEWVKRAAMEVEAESGNDLNFSLNILVIGKTGAGKSATINSVYGENKALTNAFDPATISVKEIVGNIDGITVRILDTPGFRSSLTDQSYNRKILSSIKRFTKKCPPDVVLYVDRVDIWTKDLNDLPLLRLITSSLGPSMWRNCILTLTHAASTPPDGPSGSPLSYEVFVSERSCCIQQLINHAVGDMHMLNPVSLVENHPLCAKNGSVQLLPNGKSWRPQLLLLCYSMKILSETNLLVKSLKSLSNSKLFGLGHHLLP